MGKGRASQSVLLGQTILHVNNDSYLTQNRKLISDGLKLKLCKVDFEAFGRKHTVRSCK